jgi:hypothetical protein
MPLWKRLLGLEDTLLYIDRFTLNTICSNSNWSEFLCSGPHFQIDKELEGLQRCHGKVLSLWCTWQVLLYRDVQQVISCQEVCFLAVLYLFHVIVTESERYTSNASFVRSSSPHVHQRIERKESMGFSIKIGPKFRQVGLNQISWKLGKMEIGSGAIFCKICCSQLSTLHEMHPIV